MNSTILYLVLSVIINVTLILLILYKIKPKIEQVIIHDPKLENDFNSERILNRDLQKKLGELELLHQQQVVKNRGLSDDSAVVSKKLEEELERNQKILSQKKSSEVRLGKSGEVLYPLIDGIGHLPGDLHFLGQPIDYIAFEDDYVTFIEIKTGNSRLTRKQREIKKLIDNKKIKWETVRIKQGNIYIKD